MEAIIAGTPAHLGPAIADWLRATRKLARAVLRAAGNVLVNYSRAALLLRGRDRPFRRL